MSWGSSLVLWLVNTFAPKDVSQTVDIDYQACQKAVPDILAAEPDILRAIADLERGAPHAIAAFKTLWPALKQTLTMIEAHQAKGQPPHIAVNHVQRKLAAVTNVHVDTVERWASRQNATG